MPDVLPVSAFQLCDPLLVEVLPKVDNPSLAHAASDILKLCHCANLKEPKPVPYLWRRRKEIVSVPRTTSCCSGIGLQAYVAPVCSLKYRLARKLWWLGICNAMQLLPRVTLPHRCERHPLIDPQEETPHAFTSTVPTWLVLTNACRRSCG